MLCTGTRHEQRRTAVGPGRHRAFAGGKQTKEEEKKGKRGLVWGQTQAGLVQERGSSWTVDRRGGRVGEGCDSRSGDSRSSRAANTNREISRARSTAKTFELRPLNDNDNSTDVHLTLINQVCLEKIQSVSQWIWQSARAPSPKGNAAAATLRVVLERATR